MLLFDLLENIEPASISAYKAAEKRWNSLAKPLRSLGILENTVCRIASILNSHSLSIPKKAVIVMCADNGIVAEGVTQTGQEVSALVTDNISRGLSSVCLMASVAAADVFPVDIGLSFPTSGDRIIRRSICPGTNNFTRAPAMSPLHAHSAIITGIELVADFKAKGYSLLATGEMGIGNTTTSSAIASVLLSLPPSVVTGRGAGLSDSGLANKIATINKGILFNKPDPDDPLDVLHKLGGLDIAGLTGICLGGAIHSIPILLDGFISSVAALLAVRFSPLVADYILPSHLSNEPAGKLILDALNLKPPIFANMSLGEGTGAVAMMPLIDMAISVYSKLPTFDQLNIDPYTPLS